MYGLAPWEAVAQWDCRFITTDASGKRGLGAHFEGKFLQRKWTEHESLLSIYVKEMIVIKEALNAWGDTLKDTNVLVWCDN